jgi:hypothetical protein
MGVVDTSTSPRRNLFIRSLFGAFNTSSERSIQEVKLLPQKSKKRRLGPQNDPESLGLEKL